MLRLMTFLILIGLKVFGKTEICAPFDIRTEGASRWQSQNPSCDRLRELVDELNQKQKQFMVRQAYLEFADLSLKISPQALVDLSQIIPLKHIDPSVRDLFMARVYEAYSQVLPKSIEVCMQNPVTFQCDNGEGLLEVLAEYLSVHRQESVALELVPCFERFAKWILSKRTRIVQREIQRYQRLIRSPSLIDQLLNSRGTRLGNRAVSVSCLPTQEGSQKENCWIEDKDQLLESQDRLQDDYRYWYLSQTQIIKSLNEDLAQQLIDQNPLRGIILAK